MKTPREYPLFERMQAEKHLSPEQALLYRFCSQVRGPAAAVDREVLEALADRLERVIFEGEAPAQALGLARRRGAQRKIDPNLYWRRVEISSAVHQQRRAHRKRTIDQISDSLVPVYREKASYIRDCYEELREEGAAWLKRDVAFFLKRGHTFLSLSLSPPKSPL